MEVNQDDFNFWAILERDLQNIPAHIKNAFHLCGFSNPLSFKDIDDDDIMHVQNFVQKNLMKLLESRKNEKETEEIENSMFFGAHVSNPGEFIFNRGERKLIKALIAHVKCTVDGEAKANSGLKHFRNKLKIKTDSSKLAAASIGSFFGAKARDNIDDNDVEDIDDTSPMNSNLIQRNNLHNLANGLFEKAKAMIASYTANLRSSKNENFDINMVNVRIDKQNKLHGTVKCIFCGLKEVKVAHRLTDDTLYWVLSNLKKHFVKCHASPKNKNENGAKSKKLIKIKPRRAGNETDIGEENVSGSTSKITGTKSEATGNSDEDAAIDSDSDSIDSDNEIDVSNNSSIMLHIEPSELGAKIIFYEDFIYTQISTQKLKMINTTFTNKENSSKFLLGPETASPIAEITISEIDGDGSCMFAALSHQLFYTALTSNEHTTTMNDLRQNVIKYINENYQLFKNELRGRVYDRKHGMKLDNMEIECQQFLNEVLPRPETWGGAESLKAISNMHNVNIVVIHPDGSCNFASRFDSQHKRFAIILFQNNNHYHSVVDIPKKSIALYAKDLADQQKKYLNFSLNVNKNKTIILD